MRISHTRQPSRPTPPSAKERLSALGNVGNRRGNVNSDCEKVRGTFQGNMIFGRWQNLPSLFPSHPMSAYFLVNSKPMVFFHTLPAGQWWGLMFPLPPRLIEVMIVKVQLVVLMLIKGNLLQKHQCCSGSVQLCISSLLNRSTSTSVGNNCLVGKDGEEELKLKRERKKNKIMK